MWKKLASLSLATARASRSCRSGRPVKQHALGRIDAEPLEDLGVASGSSTISRS
jgi:hypothetical protein